MTWLICAAPATSLGNRRIAAKRQYSNQHDIFHSYSGNPEFDTIRGETDDMAEAKRMTNKWGYRVFIFIAPLSFLLVLLWFVESVRMQEQPPASAFSGEERPPRLELTFWNTWVHNEVWDEAVYERIRDFEREHPEIKINVNAIPHDEYKIKVKAAAAGRELPDMLVVWPGAELEPLVAGQTLMPIDDLAGQYRDKLIPAGNLADYAVKGRQYAIPLVVNLTSIVYYDKALLKNIGYDRFPDAYAQLKELIPKVRAMGKVPIALGNKGKWVLQSCYLSTIGNRFTGDDFLMKTLRGESKFTDPDFVSALRIIAELNRLNAFNADKNNLDDEGQQDMFIQGKSAMVISGSWALSRISDKYPQDKSFGLAVFPAAGSGKGSPASLSGVTGQGIALNANLSAEKRRAAIAFLQTMNSDTTYKKLLRLETLVPANVEAPPDAAPAFKQMFELTRGGMSPVYDAVLPTELTDALNQSLQEMTTDTELTPEKVAARLQGKLDAIRKEQYEPDSAGRDDRR
jgi:raffinose/stachyose/melibiose transport system substrate-binding protein